MYGIPCKIGWTVALVSTQATTKKDRFDCHYISGIIVPYLQLSNPLLPSLPPPPAPRCAPKA